MTTGKDESEAVMFESAAALSHAAKGRGQRRNNDHTSTIRRDMSNIDDTKSIVGDEKESDISRWRS